MSNINEKNQGPRWYVAHTYTGYENKVKDSIEKIVENRGLGHLIYDIKVPAVKENVLDENGKPVLDKNGEEKIVETKLFPSYVFVKMTMNDESWHVVRNITGVTGFVGPGSEPTPLTDEEVEMFQVEVITDEFKYNLGDKVKVVSGIFEGYSGMIHFEGITMPSSKLNPQDSLKISALNFCFFFSMIFPAGNVSQLIYVLKSSTLNTCFKGSKQPHLSGNKRPSLYSTKKRIIFSAIG